MTAMQLRSGKRKLDAIQPNLGSVLDPGLDIATLVFSHVQCVETRFNLALVSKLWREASKPAAAYPSRFDLSKLRRVTRMACHGDRYSWQSHEIKWQPTLHRDVARLMDNDGVLSLPCDRVFQLLRESFSVHCYLYFPNRGPRSLKCESFDNVPMWLFRVGFATGRVRLIKLGSSGRFHNLLK
tara:strand:+ start:285 stop:833 length:549 start_codon:yes stop_codon:yes gene_type:complete